MTGICSFSSSKGRFSSPKGNVYNIQPQGLLGGVKVISKRQVSSQSHRTTCTMRVAYAQCHAVCKLKSGKTVVGGMGNAFHNICARHRYGKLNKHHKDSIKLLCLLYFFVVGVRRRYFSADRNISRKFLPSPARNFRAFNISYLGILVTMPIPEKDIFILAWSHRLPLSPLSEKMVLLPFIVALSVPMLEPYIW